MPGRKKEIQLGGETSGLKRKVAEALTSLNVVFHGSITGIRSSSQFASDLRNLLISLDGELDLKPVSGRLFLPPDYNTDSIDWINAIVLSSTGGNFFRRLLHNIRNSPDGLPAGSLNPHMKNFHVAHIARLAINMEMLVNRYISMLEKGRQSEFGELSRLAPSATEFFSTGFSADQMESKISRELDISSPEDEELGSERAYKFSIGKFLPAPMGQIRPTTEFFGYSDIRDKFRRYFTKFVAENENVPLLISSLPGLGKTHFTISYSLEQQDITLILCKPHDLEEPLENLIGRLEKRAPRKFVLFFDDIDPKKIDWYYFRTNVGGTFMLPRNITVAIASNYEFPANIISRGRGITFPMFDEIRCQEMIHDFLVSLGMRNPSKELVSVIAADYVEEYGQHVFDELSPRTLVRYLERYNSSTEKRKKTLEMSKQKVIPVPDSACFYDANQKVVERLAKSL